jgi:acetyl esterase/lipase
LPSDPARIFLGGLVDSWPERARAASPLWNVRGDVPPMLLVHGTDDPFVPLEQSLRMAQRLSSLGVAHRLIVVPGARHGFDPQIGYPEPRDLLPEILAFLENVWQAFCLLSAQWHPELHCATHQDHQSEPGTSMNTHQSGRSQARGSQATNRKCGRFDFSPQPTNCLEERLLLSGLGALARSMKVPAVHARRTPSPSVRIERNMTYTQADGMPEQLDVYLPDSSPPAGGWPVIVAIHGGGWRRLDKSQYGPQIASAFVPAGYAVVAPNYPLSAPGAPTWPLNLEDLQDAVRWVRQNAGRFGFDPSRIAAMGESAGANLANLLGTSSGSSSTSGAQVSAAVEAVISFSSPTDLAALYAESPLAGKAVAQFLGGTPAAIPATYLAASPVNQVSANDPPTFLVHGADDTLVPSSQSEEMAAVLREAGVPNRLVLISGGSHNLDFPIMTPRSLVSQILEFLAATWKDKTSHSETT